MWVTELQCLEARCGKYVIIYASDFKVLDNDGLTGVYCCPLCRTYNIKTEVKPRKITRGSIEEKQATSLAGEPGQGPEVSVGQLRGPGLRDHELGEGAPKESREQSYPGNVVPRSSPSPYEAECSKYLGLPEFAGG